MLRVLVLTLSCTLSASALAQAPAGWNDLGSGFQGGLLEPWSLAPPEPAPLLAPRGGGAVTDAEIECWIDALQHTERADLRKPAQQGAGEFLPWADPRSHDSELEQASEPREDDPLLRLVQLGPRALRQLLAHLDDARPTGVWLQRSKHDWRLELDRHVHGNPLNSTEASALGEWVVKTTPDFSSSPEVNWREYELKVGDLCFVALGQIVNRPHYVALRRPRYGLKRFTSPVKDGELARMLRAAWSGADPRRMLWESLRIDFRTRGQGTDALQIGAAARLAYYFPDSAAGLLARRLDGLMSDERRAPEVRFFNAVDAEGLLEALCPSGHPRVAAAWERAMRPWAHAPLLNELFEGAPEAGVDPSAWLAERFEAARERGDEGAAIQVLRASLRFGPKVSAPIITAALAQPDPTLRARTCRLLADAPGHTRFAVEPLIELLTDRRPGGQAYAPKVDPRKLACRGVELGVERGRLCFRSSRRSPSSLLANSDLELAVAQEPAGPRPIETVAPEPAASVRHLPLRVCDEALIAIACITKVPLELATDHEGLERQMGAWKRWR